MMIFKQAFQTNLIICLLFLQFYSNFAILIRPNNITIGNLTNIKKVTLRESIINLIKIESKYIHYVDVETEADELLETYMHPLVQAVHFAYTQHLPLVLTPDIIWYCISSATATHINLNSERLQKQFVSHQEKHKIEIRRDDFLVGSATNLWNEVVDEFTKQIREYTKQGIADKLVANFTTTTNESKVVSQIVLMDAMQKYFEFHFSTFCGIPEVRLQGTKQDWESIKTKANQLSQIIPEFTIWMESLNEILDHFINVFDDKVDKKFWNEIYKGF
jgi:hypothetical protein